MDNLVLLTSNFPFNNGESFLESEIPYLDQYFKKIIIISQNVRSQQKRIVPSGCSVFRYNPSTSLKGFFLLPKLIYDNFKLIRDSLSIEIRFRKEIRKSLTLFQTGYLVKKVVKAIQLRDFISEILSYEIGHEDVVLYSYWLNTGAQAIAMLNRINGIKIARAHGSDLYEEYNKSGYLPLFKHLAENLNAIFFVSENGLNYFKSRVKKSLAHLLIARLGVNNSTDYRQWKDSQTFVIVSCSNLIPLKRIDLLIKSLALLVPVKEVSWIHFGDGILRKELEDLASFKLGNKENIKFTFAGHILNYKLMEYYNLNQIDLFINTSITEGVPVSIMEAQSFSIPVIATDVGGIKEIVGPGSGILLQPDFDPLELAKGIEFFMRLPTVELENFRKKAKESWERNFNASKNYPDFIDKVNSIFTV